MEPDFDAYTILQIDPLAEEIVLDAAYRALSRRYHPDGESPSPARMADINRAYALLRTPALRRRYDVGRKFHPAGPAQAAPSAPSPTADLRSRLHPDEPPGSAGDANGQIGPGSALDFGRYEGWKLRDLARRDPDYLRWLARHSSGIRYRTAIEQVLREMRLAAARE
ncbi:MAG TPA: DnaJ domain-containing protein [Candidatus Limnocylindria bacterium]|nr:DnaJ domain-containing protein [Candidatus Limnocylindria bacterium]